MLHRRLPTWVLLVGSFCLAVTLSGAAHADPPSWSAFEPASFSGIGLTPQLQTGVADYVLTLGPEPKIVLGGNTYNVNWVQAFFVVSQDQSTGFTATNGTTVKDWIWESKPNPGRIAGWHGQGPERLYPGESKAFGFARFDVTRNAVLVGLHVGYQNDGCVVTGWYKGVAAPEPATVSALLGCFGLLPLLRHRRRS